MDEDPNCRSFSWKVLRQAKLGVGATTYIGVTALMAVTAPPFFENVVREDLTTWRSKFPGSRVITVIGPEFSCEDQAAILPTL